MKSLKPKKLTKHQVKTEATLRGLLDAAETIFVRDGYERAQIETIAAGAGRTKGAVYAHFRSKEDIFFALLEKKAQGRRDAFRSAVNDGSFDRKIDVVRHLFLGAFEEESWPILMLEFKLFALRNQDSFERIRAIYRLLYDDIGRKFLAQIEAVTREDKEKAHIALAILRGLPSAVALERQFNPVLNSSGMTRQALGDVFDSLFQMRDKEAATRAGRARKHLKSPKAPRTDAAE